MAATGPSVTPDPLEAVRARVDALLATFLAGARARLAEVDPALGPVAAAAAGLVLQGGKRLRPAFVHWGSVAAGREPDERVLEAAAAVELLHAFALIHDDVMDRSDQRRGRPAVHREMAAWHAREGLRGDPDWFGTSAAILAGDLVFVWADELFDRAVAGRDAPAPARDVFTSLRLEVMAGQYLDLRLAGLREPGADEALRVALLKSGRYTVTRPLLLGAAMAGGGEPALREALAAYGDALGVAFQLRDDVLGLFGDPADTGKGRLSDLREGKRTLLVLRALELADGAGRDLVVAALGDGALDEAGAARVRDVVRESGALDAVEAELRARSREARDALAAVPEPARGALAALAAQAVDRTG